MTDRYRYLPCALHEALVAPDWAGENREGGGPFPVLSNDHTAPEYGIYLVDLAHPAGWDHAVRALAAIRGIVCEGSMSYQPGAIMGAWADDWSLMGTPAGRREALCRCICAALNLRVEEVFP